MAPPDHALYDDTVEAGPQGTGWIWEAGPAAIVWDNGLDASYWENLPRSRRTVITITQRETTNVVLDQGGNCHPTPVPSDMQVPQVYEGADNAAY